MYDQRMVEDFENDSKYLRALDDAVKLSEIEDFAIRKALESHPVTKYVRDLPFKDFATYPAISGDCFTKSEIPYLAWTLPGRDRTISERLGCGVPTFKKGDIPMTACQVDKMHEAKAIGRHCWTLGCINCMNSTAIRRGVIAENRILAFYDIMIRKFGKCDRVAHWVLSPPQKEAISAFQLPDTYKGLYKNMIEQAKKFGLHSGAIVTHPWRLNGDPKKGIPSTFWNAGPHFHIIGYGHVDTDNFRMSNEGWLIKKIHPDEDIRSVRQTVAYLLTHAGLCSYMRPDVDFGSNTFDMYMKYKPLDPVTHGRFRRNVPEDDEDYWDRSDFGYDTELRTEILPEDWEMFTRRQMKGYFKSMTYFGALNSRKLSILDTFVEEHVRQCSVCQAPIGIFHNVHDCNPEPAKYLHRSRILCQTEDKKIVKEIIEKYKQQTDEEGLTILDVAMAMPQCSTPETQGVQKHEPNFSAAQLRHLRDLRIVFTRTPEGWYKPYKVTAQEEKELRAQGAIE